METSTETYLVEITPGQVLDDPAWCWRVVAPDGRVMEDKVFWPAWKWWARHKARKAAKWLAHTTDGRGSEKYVLRREFHKGER